MSFAVPAEVLAIFRDEVRGYFDVISDAVTALEQPLEPERRAAVVRDVARKLHNIKGAASSVSMSRCAKVAHATEEMLLRESREAGDLSRGLALLVRAVTWMQEALDNVELDAEVLLKDLAGDARQRAVQPSSEPTTQPEALPD